MTGGSIEYRMVFDGVYSSLYTSLKLFRTYIILLEGSSMSSGCIWSVPDRFCFFL
ncbi:unnamed protein product [Haemonchus placei]|uniref:Uncharacterized protein n=1 Tax=Haemonchus placei TaxID=6290 RepID=A0A0N4X9K0_HAEPC|nr:unnamed protein product [Haemonchus placei]